MVVLSPSSVVQSAVVTQAVHLLHALGLSPSLVTFSRTEAVANVLMVVPAGLLGTLSFTRSRWQEWAAYGFLGSLAVELVQGFLLPGRSPSATDVVANTLGVLAGAVAGSVVRRRRRRVSAPGG